MRELLQSLTANLTAYYQAVFSDIAWLYRRPSEMKKDLSRFSHELAINGSRFVTIDLPALGKHFDKCLDQGQYIPSELPYGALDGKAQVPVLLRDLYLKVFDTEGKLRPYPSIDAVTALRTLLISAKKIRLECAEKRVLAELENFERIERETREPTLDWSSDRLWDPREYRHGRLQFADVLPENGRPYCDEMLSGVDETTPVELIRTHRGIPRHCDPIFRWSLATLQRVCDIVFSSLGDFYELKHRERPKHGPGVTADQGKWDDKFLFSHWPLKLENTYPYDYFGSPNLGEHWRSYDGHLPGTAEIPSRVIAVPKTQKAPRLIAAEPTAHQWIQQLVWSQLESRLKDSPIAASIHFRDQTYNQDLARKGSLDGTYATVDLSSASDRLSCWTVERASRCNPTLLDSLHACRTRWVVYEKRNEEHYLMLKKFAPMGSACTFPVQTIVYTCVAIAALLTQQGRDPTTSSIEYCSRQISVFGDDIVIPSGAVGDLVDLLSVLGLRVNADKTYSRGKFRESCGAEWWDGNDVSVPYLLNVPAKSKLTTLSSHIGVRNNFYKRGFWATARWLESWIRNQDKIPTALLGSGEPGLFAVTSNGVRRRFSKRLHRFEEYSYYPVLREKTIPRAGWSALMDWYSKSFREEEDNVLVINLDHLRARNARTELTLSNASIWKLGWHPCHQTEPYSVVRHGLDAA